MFCPKCGTENPDEGKFCRKCGTGLSAVSQAIGTDTHTGMDLLDQSAFMTVAEEDGTRHSMGSGRHRRSKDPVELYAAGIRSSIFGFGFLIISAVLFFTNVAGGQTWWWAMLFPGFSMIAGGIGNIAKSKRLEKRMEAAGGANPRQMQATVNQVRSLEQGKTAFVPASTRKNFETGDLVPPSVVENTTRHLNMDSEGETMTLPDPEKSG
jgi:hypothetical protein